MKWLTSVPILIIGVFSLVLMFAGIVSVETAMDTSRPEGLNPLLVQNGEKTPVGDLIQPLLGLSMLMTLFALGCLVYIQWQRYNR